MNLLYMALITFGVAVAAGIIGFTGTAGRASGLAKGLAIAFTVATLAVIIMVIAGVRIPL